MDYEIKFDNCTFGFYKPGDEVAGTVLIKLRAPLKYDRLVLSILGKGYVQWTERHGEGDTQYRNNENYIDQDIKVHTSEMDAQTLSADLHTFPFHFTLPTHIPQSVEVHSDAHTYSFVRYFVRFTVDRGMPDDNISFEQPFFVCGSYDLNGLPNQLKPVEYTNKIGGGGCCGSSEIKLTCRFRRTAFTPGEEIVIDGELNNNTDQAIRGLQFAFCEKVHFVGRDRLFGTVHLTNTIQTVLANANRGEVKAGTVDSWKGLGLQIPWTTVPQLVGCAIKEIQYSVRVNVLSLNGNKGKSAHILTIPVVIGAIPQHGLMLDLDDITMPTQFSTGHRTPLLSSAA